MPIEISPTPNPNALKFTVGTDVGGPLTFAQGAETDNEMAQELLTIDGVTSIFMSADFVTLSKTPEADWNVIGPAAQSILEEHF